VCRIWLRKWLRNSDHIVSYRWNNFIVVKLKSNQACKRQIPQLRRNVHLFHWKTEEKQSRRKKKTKQNRFNICTDESIIQYIPLLYTGIQYIRRAAVTEKQSALESVTWSSKHLFVLLCCFFTPTISIIFKS